jgi:Caspase domain
MECRELCTLFNCGVIHSTMDLQSGAHSTADMTPTEHTPTPVRKKAVPKVTKPLAQSLHIGLNAVSPAHYGNWSGELAACEADANDMQAIAKAQGMKTTLLLTAKATRAAVLAAMRAAAKALKSGDFFFLTYSGHGGQVADVTGEELDRKDETWCLFDGQLIDDELYMELSRFATGVRILVLSDSCHSGTVTREIVPVHAPVPGTGRPRMMPPAIALRTYRDHQAFYDSLQRKVAAEGGCHRTGCRARAGCRHQQPPHHRAQHLRALGDPDLGLPGQPDLDGRRLQRRLHRPVAAGLEQRRIHRQLHPVPQRHRRRPARHPDTEPVRAGQCRQLPETAAVHRQHRLTRHHPPGSVPPWTSAPHPEWPSCLPC